MGNCESNMCGSDSLSPFKSGAIQKVEKDIANIVVKDEKERSASTRKKVRIAEEELKKAEEKFKKMKKDDTFTDTEIEQAQDIINEGKRKLALTIANSADFAELTKGFPHKYYKCNRYGIQIGEEIDEFIAMDKHRPCYYMTNTEYHKYDNDKDGELIGFEKQSLNTVSETSSEEKPKEHPVELRAITTNQLRAVWANVQRRCVEEGWRNYKGELLTPEEVTLYDIDKYVIRPFTVKEEKSFVSLLPSTGRQPQRPRFFVSHWWGEPLHLFLLCIEQMLRDFAPNKKEKQDKKGGGMTADTPIWICAYANNQWKLEEAISEDPSQSSFTRAMAEAEYRTISILDSGSKVFTRIWCNFEMHLVFRGRKSELDVSNVGVWCVYTAFDHTYQYNWASNREERKAIGIIADGAPVDNGLLGLAARRESQFPFELIKNSLSIRIEQGEASEEKDKIHILNAIVGRKPEDIDKSPYKTHDAYDKVSKALRAAFVSTKERILQANKQGSNEDYKKVLNVLMGGRRDIRFFFDFSEDGWKDMTAEDATDLVKHLPSTVWKLGICYANLGGDFVEAVIEHVNTSKSLMKLDLQGTKAGEGEGTEKGKQFANVIAKHNTIEELFLNNTDLLDLENVDEWIRALNRNESLTMLYVTVSYEDNWDKLIEGTKNREPELEIFEL